MQYFQCMLPHLSNWVPEAVHQKAAFFFRQNNGCQSLYDLWIMGLGKCICRFQPGIGIFRITVKILGERAYGLIAADSAQGHNRIELTVFFLEQ